mgnify:CR=1 FL=1
MDELKADLAMHKKLCDHAADEHGVDVMELQPMLNMLQDGTISSGKARDVIRAWLGGLPVVEQLPPENEPDPEAPAVQARLEAFEEAARIAEVFAKQTGQLTFPVNSKQAAAIASAIRERAKEKL